MELNQKVKVSRVIMQHYHKSVGNVATVIGFANQDGYCLVQFPKMNVELHDGTVSAFLKVAHGKHSNQDDCLWVDVRFLEVLK